MQIGWNQIWGAGVIIVGIVWIFKGVIPIGIEGRPPIFFAKGKMAKMLGVLAIFIGLFVVFEIPKQIRIDRCLDSGSMYDYDMEKCEKLEE